MTIAVTSGSIPGLYIIYNEILYHIASFSVKHETERGERQSIALHRKCVSRVREEIEATSDFATHKELKEKLIALSKQKETEKAELLSELERIKMALSKIDARYAELLRDLSARSLKLQNDLDKQRKIKEKQAANAFSQRRKKPSRQMLEKRLRAWKLIFLTTISAFLQKIGAPDDVKKVQEEEVKKGIAEMAEVFPISWERALERYSKWYLKHQFANKLPKKMNFLWLSGFPLPPANVIVNEASRVNGDEIEQEYENWPMEEMTFHD